MIDEHPSEARLLLAFDRELDEDDLRGVEQHVRACPACRATWDRLARLSIDIAQYCRTLPPETMPAGPAQPQEQTPRWQRPWQMWIAVGPTLVAGTITVLLIYAGIHGLRRSGWLNFESETPSFAASDASAHREDLPLVSSAPASAPSSGAVKSLAVTRRSRPRSTLTQRASHGTPQNAHAQPTYYWALPYANQALPLSEGSVVMSVRLSRDQLRLAGIPVPASVASPVTDPPAASDRSLVRAKVLIGADGLPRAISFEQE